MKKSVVIMRTDIEMNKGKMIAQACHAARGMIDTRTESAVICVGASLDDLMKAVKAAKEKRILTKIITDSGKTVFHGVPTVTCAMIGPADPEDIDPITGSFKLL